MSIIHNRQIQSTLEKTFKSSINLADYNGKPEADKLNALLSRSLAAIAIKILSDTSIEEASHSITDGYNDNGIDAVYFNRNERILYVVQAKWRQDGNGSIELGDTLKFLEGFKDILNLNKEKFNQKVKDLFPIIEEALNDAGTRFMLVVVYSGKQDLSQDIKSRIDERLRELNDPTEVVTLRVLKQSNLYNYIVQGMQGQPIDIDLALFEWGQCQDPYQAFYGRVAASDVAEWWNTYYPHLFDPNIRMFLGETDVNETLIDTLRDEPEKFWYFNNGITALSSSVTKKAIGGSSRQAGYFECKDFRIVNGAQTAGAIASAASQFPEAISESYVTIRIISLEGSPDNFDKAVTKYNNTQNRIDRRDFVALDSEQERLRTELQLEEIGYTFKSGDTTVGFQESFDLAEATIARACFLPESSLAVQAKAAIGRLWDDIEKPPYKKIFNPSVTGPDLWKLVQVLRSIEEALAEFQKLEGKEKLLAVHGNRFLAHLVFQALTSDLDAENAQLSSEFKSEVIKTTHTTYYKALEIIGDQYPNSYLASLFKNQSKCSDIRNVFFGDKSLTEYDKFQVFFITYKKR
ncbi:MAG: AIPR family protein [Thermosynechococcaceae cyanobacterium]